MKRGLLSISILILVFSTLLVFQNMTSSSSVGTANAPTMSAEDYATFLHRRLAGVTLNINESKYTEMVNYIRSGRSDKAAELAINSKEFYNVTVRDFAGKMSTREGTTLAPLSDFVATVIGVVRDDLSATELLTGNFYYRGSGNVNILEDVVRSNRHYASLETSGSDLSTSLIREDGQKVVDTSNSSVQVLDDSAGLLTSRAFMSAHANAGTNRRIIEFAFKIFQCAPIETWASITNPDSHVGRDVGRTPAAEYNSKCKGCHTGMDGLRPATAYFDFQVTNEINGTGYIKYKNQYQKDPDPITMAMTVDVPADQQLVPAKFRRAVDAFPLGYVVRNNEWVNYANDSFGWNTPREGAGMRELGQMIALSDGFKRCLVRRVFSTICKYDIPGGSTGLVDKLTDDFKNSGYKLKDLFLKTALRPECLGVGGRYE